MPEMLRVIDHFGDGRPHFLKDYKSRNLICCVLTEVGELTELVQWFGDSKLLATVDQEARNGILHEAADITIYLLRYCKLAHLAFDEILSPWK
jgi:hypothetical protein